LGFHRRRSHKQQSVSRSEIPLAIYCLEQAFEKIIEEERAQSSGNGSVEEEVVM
jgi:hypothetical protein